MVVKYFVFEFIIGQKLTPLYNTIFTFCQVMYYDFMQSFCLCIFLLYILHSR